MHMDMHAMNPIEYKANERKNKFPKQITLFVLRTYAQLMGACVSWNLSAYVRLHVCVGVCAPHIRYSCSIHDRNQH